MALTKEQRDALPDTDFAVPGKRDLPMHDAIHVKMAWNAVGEKQGLTDDERRDARVLLLARAGELGVDTTNWNLLKSIQFEAMAIEMPLVTDHPNRIPFSGIMARVDEPSDKPVGGAGGKRVLLRRAVAEAALASLLGMAVDFTVDLDGHNPQKKIGIITEAWIDGSAIRIKGFFYGADFPMEVKAIQAHKEQLGFSYECQARVRSLNDDPLEVVSCMFTGAAVLYKDKAAYMTTALAASADRTETGDQEMELKDIMDAVKSLTTTVDGLAGSVKTMGEKVVALEAKSNTSAVDTITALVKPQADALILSAENLEKCGLHAQGKTLREQAAAMLDAAKKGVMPTLTAATAANESAPSKEVTDLKASVETLTKAVGDVTVVVTDLKAQVAKGTPAPERKTVSAQIIAFLAKGGLELPKDDKKLKIADVDKCLEASGVSGVRAIEAKMKLSAAGYLDAAAA